MKYIKDSKGSSKSNPLSLIIDNPGGFTEPVPTRYSQIAECAYFKAEARGFLPGYEVEDWLSAEKELSGND